jgi:hypothetical protein
MALILRTIRWLEQRLLPKRIAQGLSHRLGAPALHYWGRSLTYNIACRRELLQRRYGAKKVPGSRNVEQYTRINRRR